MVQEVGGSNPLSHPSISCWSLDIRRGMTQEFDVIRAFEAPMHSESDDRRKGNGRDDEDDERKEQPWPDDSVPRPPGQPPIDRPPAERPETGEPA